GKNSEADRLYLQAIEMAEKTFGPDHMQLAGMLNDRAVLLEQQVRADRNQQETRTGDIWMLL
ncbi:unnamed protein product, partial [Ectocarpus fasciculatus]